ncbi:RNA-binding transcriptional accessory protein, partial [Mycobacterium sp. ITM-2017-0098]
QIAREAGLEPLADRLLGDPTQVPDEVAAGFVSDVVADTVAALEGARHIIVERAAEDAELVGGLRERFWQTGSVRARPASDAAAAA